MDTSILPHADTPHAYLRKKALRYMEANPNFTLLEMADGEGALYLLIERPDRKITCKTYVFDTGDGRISYNLYGEDSFPYRNDCPAEMLARLSPVDELYDLPMCRERATDWRAIQLFAVTA